LSQFCRAYLSASREGGIREEVSARGHQQGCSLSNQRQKSKRESGYAPDSPSNDTTVTNTTLQLRTPSSTTQRPLQDTLRENALRAPPCMLQLFYAVMRTFCGSHTIERCNFKKCNIVVLTRDLAIPLLVLPSLRLPEPRPDDDCS
jgi:hypothetical protein